MKVDFRTDPETRAAIDTLAARALALDIDVSGRSGASNLVWWKTVLHLHHLTIAPLPFAELAELGNRPLWPRLVAMRRAVTNPQSQAA